MSFFSLKQQLQDQLENLLVSRGDVIALHHNAGAASLLRCHASSSLHSQWRQPVLALNQSEWFWISGGEDGGKQEADLPLLPDPVLAEVKDGDGRWLEDAECPIRVLYVGHSETLLQGPLLTAGLAQPGLFSLTVRKSHFTLWDLQTGFSGIVHDQHLFVCLPFYIFINGQLCLRMEQ